MAAESELAMLKADVDAIKASLEAIQGRLEKLGQGEVSD
jgi:ubiquinone biosynthesis protein UbiJ